MLETPDSTSLQWPERVGRTTAQLIGLTLVAWAAMFGSAHGQVQRPANEPAADCRGKPLFVAGYTINTEATTAFRPIPEVSMDVTWVAGALSTSKLPLATLSIAVSTPAVETAYGSWSGGGSVGFTTPDSVYMFLDQNERNKLLAALKNPSQGPNWVLEKINQAINDLKTMVTNPAYDAGISVGLPGTSAMKLKPDGGMVLSLGGVIASF